MDPGTFTFEDFSLDRGDRRLRRAGEPVELSNRYFDALALLLSEPGKLVSKDRFMDEVWRGVPVTDEALTQCIKTLRRQLGDNAARPRFIETVPKHGYRFIAAVARTGSAADATQMAVSSPWQAVWLTGAAGAVGGGLAGLLGGLLYGFAASADAMGATTLLLVLMALTAGLGVIGGAGVGLGVGGAGFIASGRWQWSVLGGLAGGFVVGALAKLLGLDALNLLFGHAPRDMTGAAEGALLGAAVGFGTWLAQGGTSVRSLMCGALTGAGAGLLIPLLGGHMLGGSLDLLARQFPDSHVRLDSIARLFGENGFGPVSQAVTGATEGAVFGAGMVGALTLGRRYQR
jgi:DNA-binding winged helix-turn-helix (wHTH) protein